MSNHISTSLLASSGGGGGAAILQLGILLLIPFAMYFFMIRPQRRRVREQQTLQQSIQVGDEVVTTSGLYGKITGEDGEARFGSKSTMTSRFGSLARQYRARSKKTTRLRQQKLMTMTRSMSMTMMSMTTNKTTDSV